MRKMKSICRAIKLGCVFVILTLCIVSCKRSIPRTISLFGVDVRGLNYSIIDQIDSWCPNGDGEYYLRADLDTTQVERIEQLKLRMLENGAKKLPIEENSIVGRINQYRRDNGPGKGLYILNIDSKDNRDYRTLIFDEIKHELIVIIEIF